MVWRFVGNRRPTASLNGAFLFRHDPHRHHHRPFEAIADTLPLGSVGFEREPDAKGERMIWVETTVVDRLTALNGMWAGSQRASPRSCTDCIVDGAGTRFLDNRAEASLLRPVV